MGRADVLDYGLEYIIDISQQMKLSACIESFFETSDLVCLLNREKESSLERYSEISEVP